MVGQACQTYRQFTARQINSEKLCSKGTFFGFFSHNEIGLLLEITSRSMI